MNKSAHFRGMGLEKKAKILNKFENFFFWVVEKY